jgi:cell division protein FtsZ
LINVGLDELMTALKTTRSRCLFGSGLGRGDNRAQIALKAALGSPLLDSGSLLEDATTVLVHICGGEDMTLFEIELLMEGLTKHIPDNAHLLFGAATDKAMGKALSVTIISALPEERLQSAQVFAASEEVIEIEGLEEELAEESVEEEVSDAEPEGLEDEEIVEEDEIVEEEDIVEAEEDDEIPELDDEGHDFESPELRIMDEEEPEAIVEVEETPEEEPEPVVEESQAENPKKGAGQAELLLEGGPKGRFQGEQPNVIEGEDLDVPPYLRKKRRNR